MRTVDVVIITWNDPPEMLRKATASAVASGASSVIVLDNGSDVPARPDPSVECWRRSDENLGVAGGRNRAARLGSSELICFLDSDAELLPGSLARMAAEFDDRETAAVGPVFSEQAPEQSAGRAPSVRRKACRAVGLTARYQSVPRTGTSWDVDFVIGACLMVRRGAFESVGGFDETYFYGPEDVDLCLRLRAAGGRVRQVGAAAVVHPPRRRYRRALDLRTARHGLAVVRHLWRNRAVRNG